MNRPKRLPEFLINLLPVFLSLGLVRYAAVWRFQEETGYQLLVWMTPGLHLFRWPLALMTLVVCIRLFFRRTRSEGARSPAVSFTSPLWLLPIPSLLPSFADLLPAWLVSNGLFFGAAGLISWSILQGADRLEKRDGLEKRLEGRWIPLFLFLLFFAVYFRGGTRLSQFAGEHLGDEGHYIIQQQSLFEDRNLDIRNQLDPDLLTRVGPNYFHIAETSRAPHMYSWHPIGLPLLAAPFWPWGTTGRHLVMAAISAWGVAGMFQLCREAGVRALVALMAAALLGLAAYWALFAFRFLPEILGASLLVWSFVWVHRQHATPWLSVVPVAALNTLLAFAHDRFLPVALMSFGFYGLTGLFGQTPESWPKRLVRLSVFTLLTFAGLGLFAWIQFRRFEGGSAYPVGDTLFSYLRGTWEVFADHRGAAPLLPLLYWMIPAAVLWPILHWKKMPPARRIFALSLPLTYLANLLTTCSNIVSVGGSAVQGRYLLVAVPLLLPAAAVFFDRSAKGGKFIFLSLSTLSILPLLILLHWLPHIGRQFVQPFDTLAGHPLLHELFAPYLHLRAQTFSETIRWIGFWFPAGFLLGMFFYLSGIKKVGRPRLVLTLTATLIVHRAKHEQARPAQLAQHFQRLNLNRITLRRSPSEPAMSLYDLFCGSFQRLTLHDGLLYTNRSLPRHQPPVFAEKWIHPNDWDGRGYRWLTLAQPFRPLAASHAVAATGKATPGSTVTIVVREGTHMRFEKEMKIQEGPWALQAQVETTGRHGDLYLLIRVEAEGEWECYIENLCWIPYHPRFLESANLFVSTP